MISVCRLCKVLHRYLSLTRESRKARKCERYS
nr:MAG TPA: hypothetical protein [Caudoviricetes sp.]